MSPFDSVTLTAVSKVYGRQRALGKINLRLESGRICMLLGGNGAGKSTLLGVLSLLVRPTSGEVRFGELDFTQAARKLRGAVGLVAHEPLVYRDLTGRENLRLFERLYGRSGATDRLLGRLGLADAADRPVRTYSRGMVQRLALARALVGAPHLVLMDEPTTGLDRAGVALLRGILAELRDQGCLVALATHDLETLKGLAQHVVVLGRGTLVHEERSADPSLSLEEIYARHA